MPSIEVIALCEKSFLLVRFVKKLFKKAKVVDDVTKLADLDLDSVYVTTPIPTHFPVVKAIYLKKVTRNLFVEKTLASSWEKAEELCDLAQTFGGVNMVGYVKRFSLTFGKAKSLLDQGILGELNYFDAHAYSSDFSRIQKGSKMSRSRGGVLGDLGSHVIDLALWFFDDFEVQSASLKSILNETGEDSVNFKVKKLRLEGTVHVSWCMDDYRMPSFGLIITGSAGTLKVNDYSLDLKLSNGNSYRWFRHDLNDHVNFLLGESEYYREDEAFVKSVLNGGKVEPSFVTASKVDRVIDQVKDKVKANGN
jgi:predicted dehydrogenase